MQIYIPILYVTRMTQDKNDSINSILQNCCAVVSTSEFSYLILYLRQCKWKVATS